MDLGRHYLALTVQDIVASKAFYEKLGFTADTQCGGIEQRWLIMVNGNTIIGLYQGMIPNNTITFNPSDARTIYQRLKEQGVAITTEGNIEKDSGPCHFIVLDPDGNPILVDQHY